MMRGIAAALGALLIVSGCSAPADEAADTTSPSSSTPSRTMRTFSSTRPPAPTSALPTQNFTDEADEQFLAAIAAKGVPVTDPDEMTLAGYGVCGILNDPAAEDRDLIGVSTWVMDAYELPGPQATAVATSAIDVYCPGSAP